MKLGPLPDACWTHWIRGFTALERTGSGVSGRFSWSAAGSRRGDRDRGVVHHEAAARRVDGGADPRQDLPLPGRRDLRPESGRRQLVQPLIAGVAVVPVEPPLLRLAERGRSPHPFGGLGARPPVSVR